MSLARCIILLSVRRLLVSKNFYSTVVPIVERKENQISAKPKDKKPSFMSEIVLGRFHEEFLIYPEVLEEAELRDIENKSAPIRKYISDGSLKAPTDKCKYLLKSGLFSPSEPNIQFSNSYFLKTVEQLELDPSTALLLDKHWSLVLSSILKFGSDNIKNKYVPKLLNGELIGCQAASEILSSSDPSCFAVNACLDDTGDNYILTGEKQWIANGDSADLLLVFAKNEAEFQVKNNMELNAILVDKNMPGITLSQQDLSCLKQVSINKIKFDNVVVPADNILGNIGQGYEIGAFIVGSPKYFSLTCILGKLKFVIAEAIEFLKHRNQFLKDLKESEYIKATICQAGASVYSMESMLYFITGLSDKYDIDTSVESAILQLYIFEEGHRQIQQLLQLFGARQFDKFLPYSELLNDVHGLGSSTHTREILKLFISLKGLESAGKGISDSVVKMRNPLNFPGFIFRKMLNHSRQLQDKPKMNLHLYENLHPTLKSSAELLEYLICRLQYAVESVLVKYGTEIVNRQLDVMRIADVAVYILGMSSILARASRAYCTGIQNCDQEILCAKGYCQSAHVSAKKLLNDILDGGMISNDIFHIRLGSHFFQHGKYFFQHPTKRNIT